MTYCLLSQYDTKKKIGALRLLQESPFQVVYYVAI